MGLNESKPVNSSWEIQAIRAFSNRCVSCSPEFYSSIKCTLLPDEKNDKSKACTPEEWSQLTVQLVSHMGIDLLRKKMAMFLKSYHHKYTNIDSNNLITYGDIQQRVGLIKQTLVNDVSKVISTVTDARINKKDLQYVQAEFAGIFQKINSVELQLRRLSQQN